MLVTVKPVMEMAQLRPIYDHGPEISGKVSLSLVVFPLVNFPTLKTLFVS
jgi:hypothetical protein